MVSQASECSGFVAQSAADFAANGGGGGGSGGGSVDLTGLTSLFQTYFEFDQQIFSLIIGFNLVAFVTGYGLRRVLRAMSLV